MAGTTDKKRTAAHVLAVCNAVGFAVLFGFAAAMNRILLKMLHEFSDTPGGWSGWMMTLPFGVWVVALVVSIVALVAVQWTVRGGKAGIIVQTAIGVLQIGVLLIYGAWALWTLFRVFAVSMN